MNHFSTTLYLWIGVLFFCASPFLQAQKCGKTTDPVSTVAVAETKQPPSSLQTPQKYQPLVSEQIKSPSKSSKINQKRRQRFWKRQQRNKKKGCPAARF